MEQTIHERTDYDVVCHMKHCVSSDRSFHWHDNIEIAQVIDNDCAFLIDGMYYPARPGDIIFVPSRVIHRYFIEHGVTQVMICQFSAKLLYPENSLHSGIRHFIPRKDVEAVPGLAEQLKTLLTWMEKEGPSITAEPPNMVVQMLMLTLYHLLARNFSLPAPLPGDGKERKEFHEIFSYVREHFLEDITGSSIARSLYMPRGKVSRLFLKYAGTALPAYIRDKRIEHAKSMLRDGYPVTKTALESGFQSVRTFNNSFRETVGMTPSEFILRNK